MHLQCPASLHGVLQGAVLGCGRCYRYGNSGQLWIADWRWWRRMVVTSDMKSVNMYCNGIRGVDISAVTTDIAYLLGSLKMLCMHMLYLFSGCCEIYRRKYGMNGIGGGGYIPPPRSPSSLPLTHILVTCLYQAESDLCWALIQPTRGDGFQPPLPTGRSGLKTGPVW